MTRTTAITLSISLLISCLLTSSPAQAGWLGYLFTGREVVDASEHPFAQAVIGKEMRLSSISFLLKHSDEDTWYSLKPPYDKELFDSKTIEKFKELSSQYQIDPKVVGLLDRGTRLKVTRVVLYRNRRLGTELLQPFAIIQSGEFEGLEVQVSLILGASLEHNDRMMLLESYAKFVDEEAPVEKEPHD